MSGANTEIIEVKSITQLQKVLLPLQASGTPNEMIAHALAAQLRVLDMINSIELTSSAFDLFMESIYLAVTKAPDEGARGDIQKKAAAMIQSLFFFIEVKRNGMLGELENELDEIEKEAIETRREMFEQACDLLGETAGSIIKVFRPNANILVNLKKQFKDGFGVKVPKKINVSFFEYAFSLFEAGPDAATMAKWEWEDKIKSKMGGIRKEYNQFIYSSIDKLDRYKDILGKSVLLCELIRRFKSKLILRRVKSTRYKPYPKKPSEPRRKTPGRAPYLGFFDAIFIIPIFIYLSEKKTYEAKCLELKMKYEHELEQYQEDMRQYELDCSEIRTENESRKAEAERYYDELEKAFSVV